MRSLKRRTGVNTRGGWSFQLENIDKKIEGRKDIAWWVSRYFKLHSLNYVVETHIVMLWFNVMGKTRIHMFSLQKEIFPSKQYIKAAYREWSYEEQNEKLEGLDITRVSGCMPPWEIFKNVVFWDHFWCILFLKTSHSWKI